MKFQIGLLKTRFENVNVQKRKWKIRKECRCVCNGIDKKHSLDIDVVLKEVFLKLEGNNQDWKHCLRFMK